MDKDKPHFSQVFNCNLPEQDLDFFDANLLHDSPLFIDPFLIKRSPIESEKSLFNRFDQFFSLAYAKSLETRASQQDADRLYNFFSFKEPKEIYLGYTMESNQGSGLATDFATSLFHFFLDNTAKNLVAKKELYPDEKLNPVIFTLFAEGLGPDGISDMSANLMMDFLIEYTQKICERLGISMKLLPVGQTFDFEENEWTGGGYFNLPENPFRLGEPIVLVPKRFLRGFDLPEQGSIKNQIVGILREDPTLLERFGNLLSKPLKDIDVGEIRQVILQDNNILKIYLEASEKEDLNAYDFIRDLLQILALKNYKNFFKQEDAEPTSVTSAADLIEHTTKFIQIFKNHMEKVGWKEMWRDGKNKRSIPQKEEVMGRMFWGMANSYFSFLPECTFDAEVFTGTGRIDFRVLFKQFKIAIELKNLINDSRKGDDNIVGYIHGLVKQLPVYIIDCDAIYAFYITGQHHRDPKGTNHDARANEIRAELPKTVQELKNKKSNFQDLIYINIDLSPKVSPSKI